MLNLVFRPRVPALLAALLLCAAGYPSLAQGVDPGLADQFRELFSAAPEPCPRDKRCLCVRYGAQSNAPLRYSLAEHCPVESDLKSFPRVSRATTWTRAGAKVDEGVFVNGKLHGLWTSWHANGGKAAETRFEHGVEAGRFTNWHENGAVSLTGSHSDGQPHGGWTYRDREGRITRELEFRSGKLVSKKEHK